MSEHVLSSPSIRTLLEVDAFRAMMRRPPHLPANLRHGEPWELWGLLRGGRWARKRYATYGEAYGALGRLLKRREADEHHTYVDLALVSRRLFVPQPEALEGLYPHHLDWCSRCRRPVEFGYFRRHHALEGGERWTGEAQLRCPYCGIRRMALR